MTLSKFEIVDDETPATKSKRVGRLTDIETDETSLVDRAANGKQFLVVKQAEPKNNNERANPAASKENPVTATTSEATKSLIATRIDNTLVRVVAVKAASASADDAEAKGEIPSSVSNEVRSIQFVLKSLAGLAKGVTFVVPSLSMTSIGAIGKDAKKTLDTVLTEVETRLTKFVSEIETTTILDAKQSSHLDATADLLAKVYHGEAVDPATPLVVVVKSALNDDQRATILAAIEKSITGLGHLAIDLQTDVVVKGAIVADPIAIGAMLHDRVGGIEAAVAEILTGVEKRDYASSTIEGVRLIEKLLNGGDAIEPLAGVVVQLAKASSAFRVNRNWDLPDGDPNKYTVMQEFAPDAPIKMGSFAVRMDADNDALRRNVEAVTAVAKAITIEKGPGPFKVRTGGKGYQVVDAEGNVVLDVATPLAANAEAARLNAKKAEKKNTDTNEEGAVGATTETVDGNKTVDTNKIGAAMQGDRLNRLRGAITMLKDALGDLRAGTVSLEKFKKVGAVLSAIANELNVAKVSGQTGGVDDKRDATPGNPNMGSGVQPDADAVGDPATEVMGDGVPGSVDQVIKRLDAMAETHKADLVKRDATIATLKKDLKAIKKRKVRTAPSTAPDDDDAVVVGKTTNRSEKPCAWPSDMASWDGKN